MQCDEGARRRSIIKKSLGAGVTPGVTPAEGSLKPTAGFTFNKVICPSPYIDAYTASISAVARESISKPECILFIV
jgi:hypothetical protein